MARVRSTEQSGVSGETTRGKRRETRNNPWASRTTEMSKYKRKDTIMSEENMLTLEKFEEASEKVKEAILPTDLVYSEYLSNQTGNKVYLKPENMQFTGAYKVRGAYYKMSTLSEEERQKGIITASAGNHAQGVAYAAKRYGAKAVIVMPTRHR